MKCVEILNQSGVSMGVHLLGWCLHMPLTDRQVKALKPAEKSYKRGDSGSLFVLVMPNGSKYWRWKYRIAGREKTLAIGVYPDVSLAEARIKRDSARLCLKQGSDPSLEFGSAVRTARNKAESFEELYEQWFEVKMSDRTETYRSRLRRQFENHILPRLGHVEAREIKPFELLECLRQMELEGKLETASRMKQAVDRVFKYGIACGVVDSSPAYGLEGALRPAKPKHHAAITDPSGVAKLMHAIDSYHGKYTTKAALQLSALLFVRPYELRHMEWAEIDFERSRWQIPAEKMKMRESLIVPLARQAVQIIESLRAFSSERYVFSGGRDASRPMSENCVRSALRRLGYGNEDMTAHGFRAMARTLIDEELRFRPDWIELQLAHAVGGSLGRAYNRTQHIEGRTEMMQAWADYLDQLRDDKSALHDRG